MNTILTTYAVVVTVLILGTIAFLLISGKYKRNDNFKRMLKKLNAIKKNNKKVTLKGGSN